MLLFVSYDGDAPKKKKIRKVKKTKCLGSKRDTNPSDFSSYFDDFSSFKNPPKHEYTISLHKAVFTP